MTTRDQNILPLSVLMLSLGRPAPAAAPDLPHYLTARQMERAGIVRIVEVAPIAVAEELPAPAPAWEGWVRERAPRQHAEAIVHAIGNEAEFWGVRPEVLAALIWHESRFNPGARSRTNDHGLCQLHGRPIYDIGLNVALGAEHLAWNLRDAGGDYAGALAAYNGGPRGPRLAQCQRYAAEILRIADSIEGR